MNHDIYRKSYEANSTQRENSKLILYDLTTLENKNLFCRKVAQLPLSLKNICNLLKVD